MIESYTFGEFRIKGERYDSNVILIMDNVKKARHLPNHKLSLNDFTEIIESSPEYVIIGTGASGVMSVPDSIKEFIEEKNIKLIIEKTKDACETYNDLLEKGKKIAGFLHNTC